MQTFTWEGMPDGVSLETMTFEDLGDGRTRLHAVSLCDSFEDRDAWLRSGMEVGVNDGYATIDRLLAEGVALMALPDAPAGRHAAVAGGFGRLVAQTPDWSAPAPVDGWTARDVVEHLVEWFPGFLAGGGVELPAGPSVADDPIAAWQHHADAVQALVEQRGEESFTHPRAGTHRLADAVDQFYTADVFMHSWDLARAGGQDAGLDEDFAAQLLEGMRPDRAAAARLRAVRSRRPGAGRRARRRPADGLRRSRSCVAPRDGGTP